jgi:hypothetical protein
MNGSQISGSHCGEYEDGCRLSSGMSHRVARRSWQDVSEVPTSPSLWRLLIALIKAVSTSEMSVKFHEATRWNVSEDSHLHEWSLFQHIATRLQSRLAVSILATSRGPCDARWESQWRRRLSRLILPTVHVKSGMKRSWHILNTHLS